MKDEPDIVKELREVEKLGGLQSRITSNVEELETTEEASDEALDKTVGFIDDDVERKTRGNKTSYEKTEEELQVDLEKLKSIISSMDDLVFVLDKNGIFTDYYQPEKIPDLYVPPEVFIGKSFKEILPPHVVKLLDDAVSTMLTTNSPQQFDYRMELKDGLKWSNAKVSIRKDSSDKFAGSIVVVRDITKRKKAEEEKEKLAFNLNERLKEFKCLYNVTNSIRSEKSLEELLVDTTKYIREAWQYPEVTRSKIVFDGKEYKSDKFEETEFKQTADIVVDSKTRGVVEVYYIKKMRESDEGPFLKEERKLLDEIASYLGMYVEKIEVNKEKNKLLHDMGERVKELNCLYEVSKLIENPDNTLDDIFQKTVDLIPPSWQYPEITCARIIFEGKEFKTPNFKETKWRQSSDIRISGKKEGIIEVHYLEEKPESAEGPFLKEERHLIDSLRKQLGNIIERKKMGEELRIKNIAIKSSLNGIAITDMEGKINYVNPAFLKIWGHDDDKDILGKSGVKFWQMEEEAAEALQAIQEKGNWFGELTAERKDGTPLDIQVSASAIIDETGNAKGIIASFVDIIERKKAEEELKKKVDELEQHKKLTVGRELKMVELKNKIRELEGEKLT